MKTCKHCGAVFHPIGNQIYCTPICKERQRHQACCSLIHEGKLEKRKNRKISKTIMKACKHCGAIFHPKTSQVYCTPTCKKLQRVPRRKRQRTPQKAAKTCKQCGGIFHLNRNQVYCSPTCRNKSNNNKKLPRGQCLRSFPPETVLGLSTAEVARRLGFHPCTVAELVRDGRLIGVKVGHTWRVSQKSVDSFVKSPTTSTDCSPAENLNKKDKSHVWQDAANTVFCSKCGLAMPAVMEWRLQLGVSALNPCIDDKAKT